MRRLAVVLFLALSVPCSLPVSAATTKEVDDALARARKYIYSQHKDGSWEKSPKQVEKSEDKLTGSQWGGLTAVATYALLASGDTPNSDPRLAEAVEFLKRAKMGGSYALGLRCQVWLQLPQTPEIKTLMRRDAAALAAMMKTQGQAKGFYDYDARGNAYSLSRAQYAVLGMWAAEQAGVEVPTDYWRKVEAAWVGHQDAGGGWNYQKGGRDYPITAGMTAAGLATLYVAQDYLLADPGSACKGNPANPAIDRGLAWLADNFNQVASEQEYDREYPFATLYAVERVGVASGYKYFGTHDWYQKGADYLIKRQRKDGSWKGSSSYFGELPDTCFGILFLARGRAPLLMNKLQHGDAAEAAAANVGAAATEVAAPSKPSALDVAKRVGTKAPDWNQRPRDVANLANWVSSVAERDLNWQVLGPAATLKDLHDAPILYLSGTQPLKLGSATKAKLREYVEGGGLVLGHADCGGKPFATAFRALGAELFPKYEFRELPADHPIYTNGVFPRDKWKNKPSVHALSNGVRELMLLIPQGDPGRVWQSRVVGGKEEHWQLAANIFFYAAERRNLRYRGESHFVLPNPESQPTREIPVARLEYPGNWDPEPGGWRRLAAVLHNERQVAVKVEPVKLGAGKLGEGPRLAHLTGTAPFKLDDASRTELKRFIQSGGTLLIDAAGGSASFADAADAELKALFPDLKPTVLPPAHALYASGSANMEQVAYRSYAQRALAGAAKVPRIRALTIGGRPAVLMSREDLSAGMVGQAVDGVIGYEPKTATDLMTRIVLNTSAVAADKTSAEPKPAPAQSDVPF
jgi:hypothetical protein